MPTIKLDKSKLSAPEPVPAGIYEFRFEGFKPKTSKNGDSMNLNPSLAVINNPEFDGSQGKKRYIFGSMNSKADWILNDFLHSLGFELGTGGEFPGNFDDNWVYTGPLIGATGKLEVTVEPYMGKLQNKVKQYFCKVDNCAVKNPDIRHS